MAWCTSWRINSTCVCTACACRTARRSASSTAKRAGCEGGCVTQLVPEAKSGLNLFAELCQGGQVAPHEAHDLSQPPHTVLGLTHGLSGPCDLLCPAVEGGEVKAEGYALFAMLAGIALPVGTIAPHEQAGLYQTAEVTTHRRARHTVQPLTDRLVGRKNDHFGVSAKRIVWKEAEKPLQDGEIAFGYPKSGLRLGQLAKELPLVDGLAGNTCLWTLDHTQMRMRDRPHKR